MENEPVDRALNDLAGHWRHRASQSVSDVTIPHPADARRVPHRPALVWGAAAVACAVAVVALTASNVIKPSPSSPLALDSGQSQPAAAAPTADSAQSVTAPPAPATSATAAPADAPLPQTPQTPKTPKTVTSPGPAQVPVNLKQASSIPATVIQQGSKLTITTAGADLWVGVDEYAAVGYPSAAGVGDSVVARLDSQSETSDWAKAGVVLRNDIGGSGQSLGYAVMVLTPGHGASFEWDSDGDGYLDGVANSEELATLPTWVRLTRVTERQVAGSYSRDGRTWIQVGSTITVPGAATAQDAGVIVCSRNSAARGTAVLTGLRLDPQ